MGNRYHNPKLNIKFLREVSLSNTPVTPGNMLITMDTEKVYFDILSANSAAKRIDVSNFYSTEQIDTLISDYYTKSQIDNILAGGEGLSSIANTDLNNLTEEGEKRFPIKPYDIEAVFNKNDIIITLDEFGKVQFARSLQNENTGHDLTETNYWEIDDTNKTLLNMEKRLDEGVNLEEKFADEIANYSDKYAWLKARKTSGDYTGINIGDYFYVPITAGAVGDKTIAAQTFKVRIVGLNTYKGCGDTTIGNMIYCISDEVMNTPLVWNPQNNNNGTSTQSNPWLSSAIYAYLNGVNNYSTSAYNKVAHGVNASGKGLIHRLPLELQNVLVTKRNLLDQRYSASGLLTGGTNWAWGDMGKLWLPNEIEVYGCGIRSNLCQTSGFWFPEAGLSIQFPWFANNCNHRCKKDGNGARRYWWLSSTASSYSAGACYVLDWGC